MSKITPAWMPLAVVVLGVALSAVVTWTFKIDDRIYSLNSEVVKKVDLNELKTEIGQRLARMEEEQARRLSNIEQAQKDLLSEIRSMKERPADWPAR